MRTFSRHGCPLNSSKDPLINFCVLKVNVCVCRPQSFLKYQTTPYIFLPLVRIEMLILTCLKTKENKPHTPQQQQNPTLLSTALIHSGEKISDSLELGWSDNIEELREWIKAQVQIDRKSLGYFCLSPKILAGPDQTKQSQLLVLVPLKSSISSEDKPLFCRELSCKITKNLLSLHPFTLHLHCWAEEKQCRRDGGWAKGLPWKKGKDEWSATVLRLQTYLQT